jgi:nucleoside-diphosphate-sugar epimerase
MKILVTGGTGKVGTEVVKELLKREGGHSPACTQGRRYAEGCACPLGSTSTQPRVPDVSSIRS